MAIKTEMLRYFVGVAEAGNLADAAKTLGRSPAAVSMMLKAFEQELGASLFLTDRKNHLSALGNFTLEEAKKELSHFEGTVSAILRFSDSGGGQLRVAAIQAITANLLPSVFSEIHAESPNVTADIVDANNSAAIDLVRSEEVDFALVNDFLISGKTNLRHTLILTDRIGLLCARDSHLGRKENLYWSDLANTPIISYGLCKRIEEPAIKKALANSRMRLTNAATIQSFVRTGDYVSPMPELGGMSLPSDLIFRIPEGKEYFRDAHLIWNETTTDGPTAGLFRRILRKKIAEMGMTPKVEDGDPFPLEK